MQFYVKFKLKEIVIIEFWQSETNGWWVFCAFTFQFQVTGRVRKSVTYQSHSSHNRNTIHTLQTQVQQTGHYYHQVKYIPTIGKIFLAQCSKL